MAALPAFAQALPKRPANANSSNRRRERGANQRASTALRHSDDILVRSIASAVVDLVRTEPSLRAELQQALAAPEPANDELLSTRETSEYAKVAPGTVRRWIREGRLRAYRAGRELRVSRAELDAMMRGDLDRDERTPEELARADFS